MVIQVFRRDAGYRDQHMFIKTNFLIVSRVVYVPALNERSAAPESYVDINSNRPNAGSSLEFS